jgi:hypothetical protein
VIFHLNCHRVLVYVRQCDEFANKYFGKFIMLLYVAGLMTVMNAVNLVFLAARIQMRKKRKRSQQPG